MGIWLTENTEAIFQKQSQQCLTLDTAYLFCKLESGDNFTFKNLSQYWFLCHSAEQNMNNSVRSFNNEGFSFVDYHPALAIYFFIHLFTIEQLAHFTEGTPLQKKLKSKTPTQGKVSLAESLRITRGWKAIQIDTYI